MNTIEKTLESIDVLEQLIKEYEIVLYNDDVNSFDFVIDALIDVCEHDPIQAEQCTMLVHYKGKCAVKTGSYEELKPKCSKLLELGLSAEIH
ncbi:ATP-dependent Clp protease adaptor ClpS [Wenyingzhuangia marina]|uniref:ATP-dependent Clp protease adaptor protein ClpS n=1 Tax=Wenyingzhuangia marina TaxID=1195760 RepID=A0A1M5V3C6_9FLAO|nr:ATP-dependent Clp protease adaptor ClpS [Wenyingzhuangia marina]GGF74700.1 ATP-dependent Clp protease adaptor protein ClpS [Wenyingzhuangia marina]SHH69777.1 ATP-dependent Clp protease adaptor protein ClpS [Wenyingzhuangia marina]